MHRPQGFCDVVGEHMVGVGVLLVGEHVGDREMDSALLEDLIGCILN